MIRDHEKLDGFRKKIGIVILLSIPLILSGFTHLWNASQFPSFHVDEGVYIRRSLHILSGLGLQDSSSLFDHSQDSTSVYDHPHFGPIFIASLFKVLGYPKSLDVSPSLESITALFTVPRIIMGLLSVLDTFLIYKICEKRFNYKVAFFASLLFAVMPLNWYTRRIVLDSVMLPFILSSILFALELYSRPKYIHLLVILSGISLGLAMFTKVTSFSMIPLIIYIIYQSLNKSSPTNRLKIFTLWSVPVILIPLIWPAYAFISGDLQLWIDGVLWQAIERHTEGKTLVDTINSSFKTDPVLLILGAAGIIYLIVKREYMLIIWIGPYLILLYLVGWTNHFHLIAVIPILCIATAKIIYDSPRMLHIRSNKNLVSSAIISALILFGLITTTTLISTNLSYIQLEAATYVSKELVSSKKDSLLNITNLNTIPNNRDINGTQNITVISGPVFSWLWKYIFNHEHSFSHVRDTQAIKTEKILLVVDYTYRHVTSGTVAENVTQVERLNNLYNNTHVLALLRELPSEYMKRNYPFEGILSAKTGSLTTEIRTNY